MAKRKSIARRYFTSFTLVVLFSMALLVGIFFTLAGRYFRTEHLNHLDAALDYIAGVLDAAGTADDALQDAVVLRSTDLAQEFTGISLLVADTDGRILYADDGTPLNGDALSADILHTVEAGLPLTDGPLHPHGFTDLDGLLQKRCYAVSRPYVRGQVHYHLLALGSIGRFGGYLSDLIVAFLWAGALMLLISGTLALLTARHVSAPLAEISRAADRFGKGDFSARVTVECGGNDEVAQLAQNFNTMAASLEAIDRSRQSFMGNIAHELRTPMTSIKGFIDGMLDGVIPPEQYPRYLGLVSDEVARLTRLIQTMLDITRLEAGEYKINAKSYDIWETIGAVLMNNEKRLVDGRIGVGGYIPQRTPVYADPDLIYQVLYNIVDNAIKFTPPGGRIDLGVTAEKDRVFISVCNTGAGVPADQLPYLFDRFYKGDKSRSLHSGGAGLGMHISKVLIGVSGGAITAESDGESWTKFTFDLPQGRHELPARREKSGKNPLTRLRNLGKQNAAQ